jgi:hypothetical protein
MPKSKSSSDSPLSEDKLWGNVSPKSRLKAYMPLNRKKSSKIEDDLEEQLNNLLDEQDNKLVDLPIAPSGLLFPDVPTGKPKPKTPPLVFPAVPTGPLSRKASPKQKLTVLEQFALERSKLAAKAKSQTKKNRTMREKLDALVSRFKKGGTRKSRSRKSRAKSRSRKSIFKKGGAKSRTRKSR